jgi:hypothetical protein
MTDLDQSRYILLEGNDMSDDDANTCLSKIKMHIEDINDILAKN